MQSSLGRLGEFKTFRHSEHCSHARVETRECVHACITSINRSTCNRTLRKEERGNCGCTDRDRSVDQVTMWWWVIQNIILKIWRLTKFRLRTNLKSMTHTLLQSVIREWHCSHIIHPPKGIGWGWMCKHVCPSAYLRSRVSLLEIACGGHARTLQRIHALPASLVSCLANSQQTWGES